MMGKVRSMTDGLVGRVTYRPGGGTALVTGSCLVLVGSEMSRTAATDLWPALDSASSLEDLVEAVLKIGLRNLPTIAIAYRGQGETHLLLRGAARGAMGPVGQKPERILTGEAKTWEEHSVAGAVQLFLGDLNSGEYLPLSSGIVPADALSVDWCAAPVAWRRPLEGLPTAVPELAGPLCDISESQKPRPGAVLAGEGSSGEETPADDLASPDALSGDRHESTLTGIDLAALVEFEAQPGIMPPIQRTNSDQSDELEPDDFDDLFGATRLPLPVEHAAVRDEEADADALPIGTEVSPIAHPNIETVGREPGDVAAIRGLGTGGFSPPRSHGPAGSAVGPPSASEPLIQGVPGMTPSPVPVSAVVETPAPISPPDPVPPGTAEADNDGTDDVSFMTVSRANLGKRKSILRSTVAPSGPTVHGVWCEAGHPNPTTAAVCRSCELPLDQVNAVSMPRPVLGTLRFSNGVEVELDRSVIIGRSPKAERVSAREIPRLVALPSPDKDISRNHLEVKLDGWHVIVVDLGSTNGTVVTLPGQSPERLRSSVEQPISPGTVVTIAEEITFVYELPS
jgi:hypothetical protein